MKEDVAALEEARRLFYVGMTRAKERLELLSYKQDEGKSKEDSRFLNEVRGLLLKPGEAKSEPAKVECYKIRNSNKSKWHYKTVVS